MAQWEEQLNQILGNSQAMEQIMSLAQSLSGQEGNPPQPAQEPSGTQAPPPEEPGDPSPLSALSGLDPKLLQLGMGLLSEYSAPDDRKTALLAALKPFLKAERQEKIDQALRIARLTRVIKSAFQLLGRQGEEEQHV